MFQDTPPISPNDKKSHSRKRNAFAIAIALLLIVGISAVYMYTQRSSGMHTNGTPKTAEQSPSAIDETTDADKIIADLSNGKTATYDNTAGNRNIILADSDKGMNYVALSHKAVEEFLSSADKEIVTRLCGVAGERAKSENIVIAIMSTEVRMIEFAAETSCLDELATQRNSDADLRTEAASLIRQVDRDIKDFYTSVIIK